MQTLQPWQEVVNKIDQIESTSDEHRVFINEYIINVSSAEELSEEDKIAVLRAADSCVISSNE
jgi:hypothetical protein